MHNQHNVFVHLHAIAKYILQLNNIRIANDWANIRPIQKSSPPNAKLKVTSTVSS